MKAATLETPTTWSELQTGLALGLGSALLIGGAYRRTTKTGAGLALSSVPLLYRGITGHWPPGLDRLLTSDDSDTREELAGNCGIHVREAVRVELPIGEVYRFWRRLENLPRFMAHLNSVTETGGGRSHWVASGPGGIGVEWDAELVNEVPDKVIGWRSLPGSDVTTAGSVNFDRVRGDRATQISVNLQYDPPAGKTGAFIASLFGREASQTIREDLRRLKQLLEAGETPRNSHE